LIARRQSPQVLPTRCSAVSAVRTPRYWASSKIENPLRSEFANTGDRSTGRVFGALQRRSHPASVAPWRPQTHEVNSLHASTDSGMYPLQVVQDRFLPIAPIFLEEESTICGRRAIRERPVERAHCAFHVAFGGSRASHPHIPESGSPSQRCPMRDPIHSPCQ